jgi:hypothetical protein
MATNTSLIHFSGALGPVIGYTVRGHRYLRSMPSHMTNPRTPAQQAHRSHFSLVSTFIHTLGPIYKLGYQHYNPDLSPRANIFHHIYYDAVNPQTLTLDPARVLISRGSLPTFQPTAVTHTSSAITLRWSLTQGSPQDQLNLLLYNVTQALSRPHYNAASRSQSRLTIPLPANWDPTDHIILYAFWHNPATHSNSDSTIPLQIGNPNDEQSHNQQLVHLAQTLTRSHRHPITPSQLRKLKKTTIPLPSSPPKDS